MDIFRTENQNVYSTFITEIILVISLLFKHIPLSVKLLVLRAFFFINVTIESGKHFQHFN